MKDTNASVVGKCCFLKQKKGDFKTNNINDLYEGVVKYIRPELLGKYRKIKNEMEKWKIMKCATNECNYWLVGLLRLSNTESKYNSDVQR